jgi:hypothetical protein
MTQTTITQVREAIKNFNGATFTANDLPRVSSMSSMLHKMVMRGEIIIVSPFSRHKVYKEGELRSEVLERLEATTGITPWRDIWPEFFEPPMFIGETHVYGGME